MKGNNKIPKGFKKCPKCGYYRGITKAKYLNWDNYYLKDTMENSDNKISVSCLCQGIECEICGAKSWRPGSNQYFKDSNSFEHMWIPPCKPPCPDKKRHEKKLKEIYRDKEMKDGNL